MKKELGSIFRYVADYILLRAVKDNIMQDTVSLNKLLISKFDYFRSQNKPNSWMMLRFKLFGDQENLNRTSNDVLQPKWFPQKNLCISARIN